MAEDKEIEEMKLRLTKLVLSDMDVFSDKQWPGYYGVAYREPSMKVTVLYPIPLNVLVGWIRNVWHLLLKGSGPSIRDKCVEVIQRDAFQRGVDRGRLLGKEEGIKQGIEHERNRILDGLGDIEAGLALKRERN